MARKLDSKSAVESQVVRLKNQIKSGWKKSVEGILEMADALSKLKRLVDHHTFLEILRSDCQMSYVQAQRLIKVQDRFSNSKSSRLLESKPSALYLLAASADISTVETLARGGTVTIEGKRKTIDQLTVRDAARIKSASGPKRRPKKTYEPHRDLATLCESLIDWQMEFQERRPKLEQKTKRLLRNYISEVTSCLRTVSGQLTK